ncbi:MAG: diacylglycerol kinase family protein [Gemmatimonadota bacterium]|nr:diacylglycerol kinase family protein [Gemmatimonadota bacterium]
MPDIAVIVNPEAGHGRARLLVGPVRKAFARPGTAIELTTASGHEAELARSAITAGAHTIVVVGGDGTWNRCASALLDAGAADRVRIAFVSAGTGNDFAKNLGAPTRDVAAMAALVADRAAERRVDVGTIESGGRRQWFLNVAGFGFDAVVLQDLAGRGGAGGTASYITVALRRLLGYPGFAFTEDGPQGRSHLAMMLVFSNGANFGGAFRIAPAARVDDGLLDQVMIGDVQGLARLPLFFGALRGAHVNHPKVRAVRRARFDVTFSAPPACDLDGELVQLAAREAVVRAVPGALRVAAR